MIKYNLQCNNKHEFESWFSNSKEFEKLRSKKMIECLYCKSTKINKSIMSPQVLNKEDKTEIENINDENIVKSPMVGVAYLSADPNSPPYVKVGQHVKAGDILLLIEAMKTFNEIKAPKSGVIKKIVALNSQPVEFGDNLIIFE